MKLGTEKKFKWQKKPFCARGNQMSHWTKNSTHVDVNQFDRFDCKTEVIRYNSLQEYKSAGLDKRPSSSCWTKDETDCLMDLCQRFDLRFIIIADRFVDYLKEKYDMR